MTFSCLCKKCHENFRSNISNIKNLNSLQPFFPTVAQFTMTHENLTLQWPKLTTKSNVLNKFNLKQKHLKEQVKLAQSLQKECHNKNEQTSM